MILFLDVVFPDLQRKLINIEKPRAASNLKEYKMKYIPMNNVILKTQDMSQNKTKFYCNICNIVIF